MVVPKFIADASVYVPTGHYQTLGRTDSSGVSHAAILQQQLQTLISPQGSNPAFPSNSCLSICEGDPACLRCCRCLARGGDPSECCD
jgi:hypothetical protein